MWYLNMDPLINIVRVLIFALMFVLGTLLSLDKMVICFMVNSTETCTMKNKPIGEGFKFLPCQHFWGFVRFITDGRTESNRVT